MRRKRFALGMGIACLLAFLIVMGLASMGVFNRLDLVTLAPLTDAMSPQAQIAAGISIALWPGVICAALICVAAWAKSRRLLHLAQATFGVAIVGWGLSLAIKYTLDRPRPDGMVPNLITGAGPSFPSSHAVTVTLAAIMIMALVRVTRQRDTVIRTTAILCTLVVVVSLAARWVLRAHSITDLAGGVLLGGAVGALAIWLANLHVEPIETPVEAGAGEEPRQAAVIVNPAKVADLASFRRHVEYELRNREWQPPLWLETTPDEDGRGLAAQAIEQGVDLVIVAGGDGTTRVVCGALAESDIPVALTPAGTTNLLARNLGVPLDESAALTLAFEGERTQIDIIRFVPDDDESRTEFSAVIGGIGLDGSTFANTNDTLKSTIGPGAYVVAAAQQYRSEGGSMEASVDVDGEHLDVTAAMICFGNVGFIPGGIAVIPGAEPDDGLLNLIIASPDNLLGWAQIIGDVLAQRKEIAGFDEHSAREVRVELTSPRPWQLDGDALGECTTLTASVVPNGLTVMRRA